MTRIYNRTVCEGNIYYPAIYANLFHLHSSAQLPFILLRELCPSSSLYTPTHFHWYIIVQSLYVYIIHPSPLHQSQLMRPSSELVVHVVLVVVAALFEAARSSITHHHIVLAPAAFQQQIGRQPLVFVACDVGLSCLLL